MMERVAVAALAALALLALWFAPWATYNRETGARATVLLLPNRSMDFTGRTEAITVPGQGLVLVASAFGLLTVLAAASLRTGGAQRWLWLGAGALALLSTTVGLSQFDQAVHQRRVTAFQQAIAPAIANPNANQDAARLRAISEAAMDRPVEQSIEMASAAGMLVRRLPYGGSALSLAAFLTGAAGVLAMFFGLRAFRRLGTLIDRVVQAAAIPFVAILLALAAAAVVVLVLQPTPLGPGVAVSGATMQLAGRLDTLWHTYYVLFAGSLATFKGFLDALSFATPLIFTGLAVGFGFRAGLFNIGAPGQMVLGAIFAMFAGIYLPGPAWFVLPMSVLAAAVGGGLWGALPGFLKARFGANEVINTILLNFVAASLLLFMLSASPTFAAPAVRVIQYLAAVAGVALLAMLLPQLRRIVAKAPRLVFALVAVVGLVGATVVAQPRSGDAPVVLNLPFKVPGSEPKSHELSPAARLPRLPAMFGIDLRATPGSNTVPVNVAAWVAVAAAVAALALGGLLAFVRKRGLAGRLAFGVAVGLLVYGLGAAFGWRALMLTIPATNLNPAFLIAMAAAVFVWVFLFRTRYGFELRAAGLSPKAAEYGGANLRRTTVWTMAISGALAGLTATHYVLGGALEDYALRQSIPTSDGFDGIAVALLGGNHPVGIVLAAFLFGVLKNGGSVLNITFSDLTRDVVSMILALVVLFIAAKGFLPQRWFDPRFRRAAGGDGGAGYGGDGAAHAGEAGGHGEAGASASTAGLGEEAG